MSARICGRSGFWAIIRILLFRVPYQGPLFSETPISGKEDFLGLQVWGVGGRSREGFGWAAGLLSV